MTKFANIIETIGNTPVIKINRLAPEGINLYVKAEAFNPMGSVKDRLALGIIEAAEKAGELTPGQTVIEATSGNTGIGLAMVCAQKGYPLVLTMVENFSVERRKILRFLGAKVVLTPAAQKGTGMVAKAKELADTHGWFLCHQFENEANANIHSKTTAVEILRDFKDEPLDYWITGFGTGGTLKGVSRVLKAERPDIKVVVCEPDNSPILASGIQQNRAADGSPAASHPSFRPHLMQGWTPDFIPKLTEDAVNAECIDQLLAVKGDDALYYSKALAQKEGIFTGISAGATFAGAIQLAQSVPAGSTLLCMLPDTGERYLSTPLFEDICPEMTDEEISIAQSTPGYRFDAPPPTPDNKPAAAPAPVPANDMARAWLKNYLNDPNHAVVIFSLEWCEFCWSVKKLFKKCHIPFHVVALDSAEYQKDDLGGQIRTALNEHTGCVTIPQIFVGGDYIGGCSETFDAFKEGQLQQRLKDLEVEFDSTVELDPYQLLPAWLHPR